MIAVSIMSLGIKRLRLIVKALQFFRRTIFDTGLKSPLCLVTVCKPVASEAWSQELKCNPVA